jgi:hypothetical protein
LVLLLDGPSVDANHDAWYQVDSAGTIGWVHGVYLTGIPGVLAYLGVPYADGGTGPDGIDSAGLRWAVVN